MKRCWRIVTSSCVALICVVIIWRFVHAELVVRRLTTDAIAYRIRAEQGDAESEFKLGSLYYRGKGVPQDYVAALRWYRKSAEQGYAKAEYSLSNLFHDGKGVPQDYAEAERWCRKAAEQGDSRAEEGLGFLYYRGEGVPKDYAEAARWYRKSAEQGDGSAQYALGYMYFYGYGVPQDLVEARRLFQEAAAKGNVDAKRAIGSSKAHLPAISKVMLPFKFLAALYFLGGFLKAGQSHRTRMQIGTGVAALLLMSSFVLDLFWYFYIVDLQSLATSNVLYFARHLVSGLIVAVLGSIVAPRSSKAVLVTSAVLFSAFIVFRIVNCELKQVALTTRLFCFVGFPVGMAIPPAIFLWLDREGSKRRQAAKKTLEKRSRRNDQL